MTKQRSPIVAIYARISKKNMIQNSQKGNQSIANQIQLAKEYISKDGQLSKMQVRIFTDEGYTGTNLERPAVQKLLANIFLGRIQAVVIKDFSRLSRNHLQLSEFREHTMRKYPVVLISIGDGYDSRKQKGEELFLGVKSIFYEYYCRDISRKVKQSIAAKKEEGQYAVAKAPYGYRKGNNGRFVIEQEEGEVVKKIFQMASEGWNMVEIAKKISLEEKNSKNGKRKTQWNSSKVWRIIHNPVYMGCQVWHKYENTYEDGFRSKAISREQWRVQEEMHPAIISGDLYRKIQRMQERSAGYGKRKGERHLFHGVTKCSICKKALCRHRRKKEFLCCREKHGDAEVLIAEEKLWEICRNLWENQESFGGDTRLKKMHTQEKQLFIKKFVEKITVGEKRLWIQWKTVNNFAIIEERNAGKRNE